jgi:hypothetical protein
MNQNELIAKNKFYIIKYIKKHNFTMIDYHYSKNIIYFKTSSNKIYEFDLLTCNCKSINDPYFIMKILNPTFINSA